MAERPDAQAPRPVGRADPDELNVGIATGQDRIERQRMADGKTQIAPLDLTTKQLPCSLIGGVHRTTLNNQGGFFDRVQNRGRKDIGKGHGADPNRRGRSALG